MEVLVGSRSGVGQVAFSPDGSRVLAVAGNELGVWDLSHDPFVLEGHRSFVYDVAFLRGGRRLVSLSYDGKLCARDAATLEVDGEPGDLAPRTSYALDVARDGDLLAVAQAEGVAILDGDALRILRILRFRAKEPVRDASFSPDGTRLVAMSDTRVVLFDVATGATRGEWPNAVSTPYVDIAFSPGGRWFAHSGKTGAIVRDAADGTVLARLGERVWVEALAFSPDDALLASGRTDKTVRLFDTRTWTQVASLVGHTDRVYALAFSPDGRMLASGSNDTTIRLWDVATHDELAVLTGHDDYVFGLAFDPDGTRLASASGDKTVRLWDTLSRAERWLRRRR
jgi:WD40 repeat protein